MEESNRREQEKEENNRQEQRGWKLKGTVGPAPGCIALRGSGRGGSIRKGSVLRWEAAKAQFRRSDPGSSSRIRWLCVVVKAGGVPLHGSGGGIGKLSGEIGGDLLAPHMDRVRIANSLGGVHELPHAEQLEMIANFGVPVAVAPGRNLTAELDYGNHASADRFGEEGLRKAAADVVCARALVFPRSHASGIRGLLFSPLGVVEEKGKRRILYELAFGDPGAPVTEQPVNATTGWEEISACALAGVMDCVLERLLGLRWKFGVRAKTVIQKMNVKNAFRQIAVDADGAAAFGYGVGDLVFSSCLP